MKYLLPTITIITGLCSCGGDNQEYTREENHKIISGKEVCVKVRNILFEESSKFKEALRGEPGSFVAIGRSQISTSGDTGIGMAIGNESKKAWPVENWYDSEETIIKVSNQLAQENIAGCRYQSGKVEVILYGEREKRTASTLWAMELSSERVFHTLKTQEGRK